MVKPLAIFRFYASHWRGAGHAMRCMTLAQALKKQGWECRFATEEESYEFVPALNQFARIDPEDFYSAPLRHDLLVVDHYDCGYEYEQHFRPYNRMIMVIDDLANRRHDCDIILDPTYGRHSHEYNNDVPPGCKILTGPSFALLRENFAQRRAEALIRRQSIGRIDRVLVNFGGNDQKNIILEALQKLKNIGYQGAIDVVFGMMAPHRPSVEAFAATMPNEIFFHTDPDMPALMVKADFAIGASGTTTWERCTLGLPTILMETADNQRTIIKNLCRDNAVVGAGLECLSKEGLINKFDSDFYKECALTTSQICDGQGVGRTLSVIRESSLAEDTLSL